MLLSVPSGLVVKTLPAMQEIQETRVCSLGREDPPEEGMATHSSILAWRFLWTEETGGYSPSTAQALDGLLHSRSPACIKCFQNVQHIPTHMTALCDERKLTQTCCWAGTPCPAPTRALTAPHSCSRYSQGSWLKPATVFCDHETFQPMSVTVSASDYSNRSCDAVF